MGMEEERKDGGERRCEEKSGQKPEESGGVGEENRMRDRKKSRYGKEEEGWRREELGKKRE